jgi:prepilin-type N-terminal cleavage/methylation domain-containing protein
MQHLLSKRGFTLVETLVVVSIVGVVGIVLSSTILYFYRANTYVLQGSQAVAEARRSVSYIASNFREALYADDGAYPIATASTSTLTFYADVDKDGGVEKVRIYRVGTSLYRGVVNAVGSPATYTGQAEATTTLAVNLRNGTSTPLFTYFNSAGTELTGTVNVADIRSMNMTLMIDLNPSRAPDIYTLTGTATLRNSQTE